MDKTLIKIAKAARKEMEAFAPEVDIMGDVETLACYCAISSYFLRYLARQFGYHLTLVEGAAFNDDEDDSYKRVNHCWAVYRGMVIDITATQFDVIEKVYITPVGSPDYYVIRRSTEESFDTDGGWFEQSPLLYKNELKARAWRLATELKIAA